MNNKLFTITPEEEAEDAIRVSAGTLGEILTASEAAVIFQISPQAVRAACEAAQVECRKSGSTWLLTRKSATARWTRQQVVEDARLTHWSVSRLEIDPADAEIVTEVNSQQTVRYGRMWAYRIAGLDFHTDIAESGRVELPSGKVLRWDRAMNAGDPSYVWYESK